VQRTVSIRLEDDKDLRATLESYRIIQQTVSDIAAKSGKGSSALDLHKRTYAKVRGPLKAQLICTAIRSVSAAYAQRGEATGKPIKFKQARAMFLIGKAKRDAGVNDDGTISIWTVAGRKKLNYSVPEAFKETMAAAESFNAICVAIRNGRLHATISVTIPDGQPAGALPVGVDVNNANAIVAVDIHGRSMCVNGIAHRLMMKTGEKMRRRLEERLSTRKADGLETRSVRRAIKRLSRKRYLQTKNFCNVAAKFLVSWVGLNSVIVLEDFRRRSPSRQRKTESRSEPGFYEILRRRIEEKATRSGIPVTYIEPVKVENACSRCGSLGSQESGWFSCTACGLTITTDKNNALVIRNRYTVAKTVGCGQPAPKLDNG
jgi:putative transposase